MDKKNEFYFFIVEKKKNQDGFILMLVLLMLVVLSSLGIMVLNTTHTELMITGNYRAKNDAFVVSQVGVEYSKGLVINQYDKIQENTNYNIDSDTANGITLSGLLVNLNLSGIDVSSSSGNENEIDHYLAAASTRKQSMQSADNTTNVYTTTKKGGSQDVPYYRISVDVKVGNRGASKIETVVERVANTSF
jgi:Tfp pilus assembly protein PilX